MAETMDIWNAVNREVASPVGPCGIGSNPTVLHLNRQIKQKTVPLINDFLDEYIAKHDLAQVYALSSACFEVIESVVPLFSHVLVESASDFSEIIGAELDCFEDIERVLDATRLAEELWEVANGEHWSQTGLETPDNMSKLGQLSYELQKRIEDGPWDLSEKTHAYMCSLTIGNYKKFDYESFTYQISRGVQCDQTINNFIPYLQGEASGREALWVQRQFHVAEVLRLIQWAEIGNISEYVRGFCDTVEIHHPQPVDEDFYDSVSKCLNTPFTLFRSDLALEYLKDELTRYLFACQVWLEKARLKNEYSDDPLFHLARMTISAVYLFGAYRIGAGDFDKGTIERAGSYLQTYQQPDASFIGEQESPWMYLELNGMIVHALRISEAFGWRRTIKRAFDWIVGQLDIYGVWYDLRYRRNGYLACLLLDAIELVEGGDKLTFSMPQQKKSPLVAVTEDSANPCAGKIVIKGNIETVVALQSKIALKGFDYNDLYKVRVNQSEFMAYCCSRFKREIWVFP